ncbi:MAG: hypothetical protein HY885_14270 [Deltaproteobacteria bacterium]|nr:hypothetical protein [Deltaproteobacteria bacterium]
MSITNLTTSPAFQNIAKILTSCTIHSFQKLFSIFLGEYSETSGENIHSDHQSLKMFNSLYIFLQLFQGIFILISADAAKRRLSVGLCRATP